jgi:hypothetical protein
MSSKAVSEASEILSESRWPIKREFMELKRGLWTVSTSQRGCKMLGVCLTPNILFWVLSIRLYAFLIEQTSFENKTIISTLKLPLFQPVWIDACPAERKSGLHLKLLTYFDLIARIRFRCLARGAQRSHFSVIYCVDPIFSSKSHRLRRTFEKILDIYAISLVYLSGS